jgi:hypothetical protein
VCDEVSRWRLCILRVILTSHTHSMYEVACESVRVCMRVCVCSSKPLVRLREAVQSTPALSQRTHELTLSHPPPPTPRLPPLSLLRLYHEVATRYCDIGASARLGRRVECRCSCTGDQGRHVQEEDCRHRLTARYDALPQLHSAHAQGLWWRGPGSIDSMADAQHHCMGCDQDRVCRMYRAVEEATRVTSVMGDVDVLVLGRRYGHISA